MKDVTLLQDILVPDATRNACHTRGALHHPNLGNACATEAPRLFDMRIQKSYEDLEIPH